MRNIITTERLQKYSKPVLIELIQELRDRFNAFESAAKQSDKQFGILSDKLKQCQRDLREARKLNRQLKKGGKHGA